MGVEPEKTNDNRRPVSFAFFVIRDFFYELIMRKRGESVVLSQPQPYTAGQNILNSPDQKTREIKLINFTKIFEYFHCT